MADRSFYARVHSGAAEVSFNSDSRKQEQSQKARSLSIVPHNLLFTSPSRQQKQLKGLAEIAVSRTCIDKPTSDAVHPNSECVRGIRAFTSEV